MHAGRKQRSYFQTSGAEVVGSHSRTEPFEVIRGDSRPWGREPLDYDSTHGPHSLPPGENAMETAVKPKSLLKVEHDTGLVAEVALVVVAMSKVIAEAGEQVLELRWADGDVFA